MRVPHRYPLRDTTAHSFYYLQCSKAILVQFLQLRLCMLHIEMFSQQLVYPSKSPHSSSSSFEVATVDSGSSDGGGGGFFNPSKPPVFLTLGCLLELGLLLPMLMCNFSPAFKLRLDLGSGNLSTLSSSLSPPTVNDSSNCF